MKHRVFLAVLVCLTALVGASQVPAMAAVPAPTAVKAVPRSGSSIEITWARAAPFATYRVYRATTADGPYTQIGTTTATRAMSQSLAPGTRYFHRVRAVVSGTMSPLSAAVDARTFTPTTANTIYLNANHDNAQPDESLPEQPRQLWSRDLGGDVGYPLVAEGLVVAPVANTDNVHGTKLWAFRAGDGTPAWGPLELGGTFWVAGLAYGDGAVFAINRNGLLRRINIATGVVEWQRQVPDQDTFESEPVVVGDTLYVGGSGFFGTVYAIDVDNGDVRWSRQIVSDAQASPVVAGTGVFMTGGCGETRRLDAATGALVWTRPPGCSASGSPTPALNAGRLYVREFDHSAVLDAETGAELTGAIPYGRAPAFLGPEIVELAGSTLNAHSTANGELVWSYRNPSPYAVSPVAVGTDKVVVADEDGYVSIVRRQSPQPLWRAHAGERIGAGAYPVEIAIAVAHGLIVVPATNRLTVFG